jgi:hypothetical protein
LSSDGFISTSGTSAAFRDLVFLGLLVAASDDLLGEAVFAAGACTS